MADLIVNWHIKGQLSETGVVGANVSNQYVLDKDYVPETVYLRLKTAGEDVDGGACIVDINDDGVSIFDNQPALPDSASQLEWGSFASDLSKIKEGSVLTLDIDSICQKTAGADLTIQLNLAEA